jgi:SAM-dependent methyltransferase
MSESREQPQQSPQGSPQNREYHLENGVFVRDQAVVHDAEQYDASGYRMLSDTQRRHFWNRGRRRFLTQAVKRHLGADQRRRARVIDLGAGCGGWVAYLRETGLFPDGELAAADSSLVALGATRELVAGDVACFQVDLLDLGFDARWDVAFLLDVIEHVDDDVAALDNAKRALAPGGWLFVTVPALDSFWSWNDEVVKHKRRYDTAQLRRAAERAGLVAVDSRYFMFLLSPLLLASRMLTRPRLEELDHDAQWALIHKTHAVPATPINELLAAIFSLEAPLSRSLKFPWGTSLLGVFRRPS